MIDFFKVVRPGHKTILIRPDTGARNWHTEDVAKTISDAFKIPLDRFYFEAWRERRQAEADAAKEAAKEAKKEKRKGNK